MESIYPELALCGSKNECARTDTVFCSISEVSKGTVSLKTFVLNCIISSKLTAIVKLGTGRKVDFAKGLSQHGEGLLPTV